MDAPSVRSKGKRRSRYCQGGAPLPGPPATRNGRPGSGRAGTLQGANIEAIRDCPARDLTPLYSHGQSRADLAEGRAKATAAAHLADIRILKTVVSMTNKAVTKIVNGGTNGLADRLSRLEKLLALPFFRKCEEAAKEMIAFINYLLRVLA